MAKPRKPTSLLKLPAKVIKWLDRSVKQNEDGLATQFTTTLYQPIKTDPRWEVFREKSGTSAKHLAAIHFEVKLPQ